ncbi:MAG: hypothetical protein ACT4PI_01120 [Actinomycetota bacterium]
MTPAERTLRARMAAYVLHSRYDSKKLTAPARRAFNQRFENEVDPDGVLSPAERIRRAEASKKAYFTRLALKSAQARRRAAVKGAGQSR